MLAHVYLSRLTFTLSSAIGLASELTKRKAWKIEGSKPVLSVGASLFESSNDMAQLTTVNFSQKVPPALHTHIRTARFCLSKLLPATEERTSNILRCFNDFNLHVGSFHFSSRSSSS